MIIGKLLNLDIAEGDAIVETCWEVAKDEAMAMDKRTYYTQKPEELEAYVFQDIVVTRDANWYGRAKYRTKLRGWSDWNNLDIIAVASTEDIGEVKTLPSRLAIPRVETYYYDMKISTDIVLQKEPLPANEHPVIGFAIKADGYSSITGATHVATSYYLEDVDRNVIWKSEYNTIDLYVKRVDTVSLEDNKAYRVRVVYHSSTNDVSDGGTKTFITRLFKDKTLTTYLENSLGHNNFYLSEENKFTPPIGEGEIGMELMIMDYSTYGSRVIYSFSTDKNNREITFKPNVLGVDKVYVVLFRSKSLKKGTTVLNNTINPDDIVYGPWGYFVLDTRKHKENRPTLTLEPYTIQPLTDVAEVNGTYEMNSDVCKFTLGNILSRRGVSITTTNGTSGVVNYPNNNYPLEGELTIFCNDNFDDTLNGGVFDVLIESAGNTPQTLKVKGGGNISYPFNDLSVYTLSKTFTYDPSVKADPENIDISQSGDIIEVLTKVDYININKVAAPIKTSEIILETKRGTVFKPLTTWSEYPVGTNEESKIIVGKSGRKTKFFKTLNSNYSNELAYLKPGRHEFISPLISPSSFDNETGNAKQVKFILEIADNTRPPLDLSNFQCTFTTTNDLKITNNVSNIKIVDDTILGILNVELENTNSATGMVNDVTMKYVTQSDFEIMPLKDWNTYDPNKEGEEVKVTIGSDKSTGFDWRPSDEKIKDMWRDKTTICKAESPLIDPKSLIESHGKPMKLKFIVNTKKYLNFVLNSLCSIQVAPNTGNSVTKKEVTVSLVNDQIIVKGHVEYEWSKASGTTKGISFTLNYVSPCALEPNTTWDDFGTIPTGNDYRANVIKNVADGTSSGFTKTFDMRLIDDTNNYGVTPYISANSFTGSRQDLGKPLQIKFEKVVIGTEAPIIPFDQFSTSKTITPAGSNKIKNESISHRISGNTITVTSDITVEYENTPSTDSGLSKLDIKIGLANATLLKSPSGDFNNYTPTSGYKKLNVNTYEGKVTIFYITSDDHNFISGMNKFEQAFYGKIDSNSNNVIVGGTDIVYVRFNINITVKKKTNIPLLDISSILYEEEFRDSNGRTRYFEVTPAIEAGMSSGKPSNTSPTITNDRIEFGVSFSSSINRYYHYSNFRCPFARIYLDSSNIVFPDGESGPGGVEVDNRGHYVEFTGVCRGSLSSDRMTFTSPPIKGKIVGDKIDFNADEVFYLVLGLYVGYYGRP